MCKADKQFKKIFRGASRCDRLRQDVMLMQSVGSRRDAIN